jgi:hypothetical protein
LATAPELIRYAASLADTVVSGCSTIEEVRMNMAIARALTPMPPSERAALEARLSPHAHRYDPYKGDTLYRGLESWPATASSDDGA